MCKLVVSDETGKPVSFGNVNQVVPCPVHKTLGKPNLVTVKDCFAKEAIQAIHNRGWTHRIIPT